MTLCHPRSVLFLDNLCASILALPSSCYSRITFHASMICLACAPRFFSRKAQWYCIAISWSHTQRNSPKSLRIAIVHARMRPCTQEHAHIPDTHADKVSHSRTHTHTHACLHTRALCTRRNPNEHAQRHMHERFRAQTEHTCTYIRTYTQGVYTDKNRRWKMLRQRQTQTDTRSTHANSGGNRRTQAPCDDAEAHIQRAGVRLAPIPLSWTHS